MAAEVTTPAGAAHLQTPLLGLGNLSNVLAAHRRRPALRGAARRDDRRAPARLSPAHHRGEILRLPGGITLIDDSYNSSPAALARSLETVGVGDRQRAQGRRARRDARAGRVRRVAAPANRARCAARAGLDLLITVGGGRSGRDGRRGDRGRHAANDASGIPATKTEAADVAAASGARRRPGARQRLARHRH